MCNYKAILFLTEIYFDISVVRFSFSLNSNIFKNKQVTRFRFRQLAVGVVYLEAGCIARVPYFHY